MANVTAEVLDGDEVVIRFTGLVDRFEYTVLKDVLIRVQTYLDTKAFNISFEIDADSEAVLEARSGRDFGVVLADVANPDYDPFDADGECDEDCDCQCDTGECDCNPCGDEDCDTCGDEPEDCGNEDCTICNDVCPSDDDGEHCKCYPDDQCCRCGLEDYPF